MKWVSDCKLHCLVELVNVCLNWLEHQRSLKKKKKKISCVIWIDYLLTHETVAWFSGGGSTTVAAVHDGYVLQKVFLLTKCELLVKYFVLNWLYYFGYELLSYQTGNYNLHMHFLSLQIYFFDMIILCPLSLSELLCNSIELEFGRNGITWV